MSEAESKNRWHKNVLSTHNDNMYSTLITENNLTSNNLKIIEFDKEDENQGKITIDALRGYFASKDKRKYFIEEKFIKSLPLKPGSNNEELINNDDVIIRPLNPRAFNITPEPKIPVRELIDGFFPFNHTYPDVWTAMKMICFSGYISQDFVCIATKSSSGKTQLYKAFNNITNFSPVFKPRSVPGVLNQITTTGNMVFDEVQKMKSDIKDILEDISLRLADGSPDYINGALKSANTKERYNCHLQSITYTYNVVSNYKDVEKNYFDFRWENRVAMTDRFLRYKFDGILTEKFTAKFDIPTTADDNKMYYINYAKTLLYLQELKLRNGYNKRFVDEDLPFNLSNRQKDTLDNQLWLADIYCYSQEEYDKFRLVFLEGIKDYDDMIAGVNVDGVVVDAPVVDMWKDETK